MLTAFRLPYKIGLIVTILGIYSCGGGNKDTPPPAPADILPPVILETTPSSEQSEVPISSFIVVTFNENIDTVTTNQVSIFPYLNGVVDKSKPIILENANSFNFNSNTKKLEIRLKVDDLQANTQYQVIINDIVDTSANPLLNSCIWDFTTVNAPAIKIGKTGVCSTVTALPSKPQNLVATTIDSKVILKWESIDTNYIDHYKVEVSIDNQISFSVVNENISGKSLSFVDTNVQNDVNYIYRITANNMLGDSSLVISNVATPKIGVNWLSLNTKLNSDTPRNFGEYGTAVAFSPDGQTLAIGENARPDQATQSTGAVFLYKKSTTDNTWIQTQILTVQFGSSFGIRLTYSPDGSILAIGELLATVKATQASNRNSSVYLFTQDTTGTWILDSELVSQDQQVNLVFGSAFNFSLDSKTLAIAETGSTLVFPRTGRTHLFTLKNSIWTRGQTLTSVDQAINNGFGSPTFSPDGITLAINGPGKIHLFTLNNSNKWVNSSNINTIGLIAFDSTSDTLAIGKAGGNAATASNSGIVEIYTKYGNKWKQSQILTAKVPITSNGFGSSIEFSTDGLTLAISEYWANSVSIFIKSELTWNLEQIISPATTTAVNEFGSSISFNNDGSLLAIGNRFGSAAGIANSGFINLYSK